MTDGISAIRARRSANNFDPTHVMSAADISALVTLAGEASSSFNQQNWRAIAVTTAAAKAKLMGMAYGQAKVGDAAVTFIMVGNPGGYKDLARLYQPMFAAGAMDQAGVDGLAGMADGMYAASPQMQHDEAIRSAALAGMTLMLAAHAGGLASGPMIGFDAAAVATEFGLKDGEFAVMLITCGKAAPGNWPRKPRRSVSETLTIV